MEHFFSFKTAKKKFQGLVIGLVLLLLLAYQFSINKTITAYKTYRLQTRSLDLAQTAPTSIQKYQQLVHQLEGQLHGNFTYDREQVFEMVNTFCAEHHLSLSEFHPERRHQSNDYEIITTPIEVQGNYTDMVKLAYKMEFTDRIGHIASLDFEMVKDRISKKNNLVGTMYLQNIRSDESN